MMNGATSLMRRTRIMYQPYRLPWQQHDEGIRAVL